MFKRVGQYSELTEVIDCLYQKPTEWVIGINSPQIPSIYDEFKASVALKDIVSKEAVIIEGNYPYRRAFAVAVRQLAWQTPSSLFNASRNLWDDEQYQIMKADVDSKQGVTTILSISSNWAGAPCSSLELVREVIARNFTYFKASGAFDRKIS
jgi:hypothetical protein